MNEDLSNHKNESIVFLSDQLVIDTQKLLKQANTEEDLRIGFEKLLEPIKKKLEIELTAKYEKSIYRGRSDAVHGQMIIEYELPGSFKSQRNIDHAFNQLVDYIIGESKSTKLHQLVGVGFDGEQIFFVQYHDKEKKTIDKDKFTIRGPLSFTPQSARTFLIHLRALARLPLSAENLADKFGPDSDLAPKAVSAYANSLKYWGDRKRVQTYYNEWKRLFGIVYGEHFSGQQEEETVELAKLYNVSQDTDFQELLFSIHTYFAFLMKLIAAELLTLKDTTLSSSLSSEITHLSEVELKLKLEDIENGGIYSKKGITNFLEGDFFRWYLDAWSPRLKEVIQDIARALSEFEPATSTLDPTSTRDLLKKLYQYLVPKEVRHRLGEYYTPDWLAELVLNEVGYDGNNFKRILDPACGSGTFIVYAIQRALEWGIKSRRPEFEIAKSVTANIWGFDLNPLAVIATRTNYLFALGDFINGLMNLEIPIYLADSVLWPEQMGRQKELNYYGGDYVKVKTSKKEFHVPSIWIKDNGFRMSEAALMLEKFIKNGFEPEIAMKHFKEKGLAFPPNEKIIENFYKEILELEKENENGIWARFLKNAFAPMASGKFDYVVGNPPWIRWGYLTNEYREATLPLWKEYGLFSLKGHDARLGGGEKDFSMLFTYAASDYYLLEGAKLGFLITQEVFKSKGAGEGFRRFKIGEHGKDLKVLKAHDLVTVQPFEGAANKTALIILKKGQKTKYPIKYTVWSRIKGVGKIPTDTQLKDVLPLLQKTLLNSNPMGSFTGAWQTISENQLNLVNIEGKNSYQARRGASTDLYGVFWITIRNVLSDGTLLIRNLNELGKQKINSIEDKIESDLVFPAVSGANIKRWIVIPKHYVIICQDPDTRIGYPEEKMKKDFPQTYGYLLRFRKELMNRASYKKYHEESGNPFYSQYNIANYSLSNYKVVWKRMSNDITSVVVTLHETPFGYKTFIPTDTTSFFPCMIESEAHYLCAIINSNPVREFIKSFSSAGRGFGTPSIMQHVGIDTFNPENELHQKLADISKKCHQFKSQNMEKEIELLESDNDKLVKELFGIE
jgi:hypothetical protein